MFKISRQLTGQKGRLSAKTSGDICKSAVARVG